MSLRYPTEAHRRNTKWPTPPEAIEADALSVRDASEMLGVPYWWMSERIQSGKIKVLRFYLRPFVPLAEVKLRANEILGRHLGILKETPIQLSQQNVFAAIVERAQGNALAPVAQYEDDAANVIDGEVVERENAPANNMASVNPLEAFRDLDDGEDEMEDASPVVETTPANEAPQEDEALKRRDDFVLWRGRRRRNV